MRTAYVVITKEYFRNGGDMEQLILAVCPDEATAEHYIEVCKFECIAERVPLMESSAIATRGDE